MAGSKKISYLVILVLFCVISGHVKVNAQVEPPLVVAQRAVSHLLTCLSNSNFFDGYAMGYDSSIIFDGFYELLQVFPGTELGNLSAEVDYLLDYWELTDTNADAYQILHGNLPPYPGAIGDNIGLFPIAYIDRINYNRNNPNYNNATDLKLAKIVANHYIFGWPIRLPDHTIARNAGWPGETGSNSFLWSDDQFMGNTLLNRLAILTNNETLVNETAQQQLNFGKYMQDRSGDNLFWHGYNHADNHTSCCKWGRANGWVMMSHVEALLALSHFPGNPYFNEVLALFQSHALAAVGFQSATGLWHQVINCNTTFLETSVSAMFLYSFIQGVNNKWLDSATFLPVIKQAYDGVSSQIQSNGVVNNICTGTGIMTSVAQYNSRPTNYNISGPGLGSVLRSIAAYGAFSAQYNL